jgi:hypothetical protein
VRAGAASRGVASLPVVAAALLGAAGALVGCAQSGPVNATGKAALGTEVKAPDGTRATAYTFTDNVPGNAADPTGFATPAAGARLAIADAQVCVGTRPVLLNSDNFAVEVDGGTLIRPKQPQALVADELASTGEDECNRGEIVFDVPIGETVDAVVLDYAYDRVTGSNDDQTNQHVTVHLTWPVPAST